MDRRALIVIAVLLSCTKPETAPVSTTWLIGDQCAVEYLGEEPIRRECCDTGEIVNVEFILTADEVILTCK